MAYTFSTGNTPATGGVTMYLLISTLVSAGWIKVMDSDGITYSSSGTQITSGSSGANGCNNTKAWARLQAPAVNGGSVVNQQREIIIQRGTTSQGIRVKYSASAKFTGGSPANTVTPSATDEVFMLGGGTDASPTYSDFFFASDGTYRIHIAAGGLSESYSFYMISLTSSTTTELCIISLDVMVSGSYPSVDVDPAVMLCSGSGSSFMSDNFPGSSQTNPALARSWFGPVSNAGASLISNNQNVGLINQGGFGLGAVSFAVNPFSGKDTLVQVLWGRRTQTSNGAPGGIKGFSTLFKAGTMKRTNLDTCDVITAKDKIYWRNMWLPWDGSTPVA